MDRRTKAGLFLALSIILCLGGIAGFIILFRRNFNVYWFILAPIIIAVYQVPAAWVFRLYRRARRVPEEDPDGEETGGNGSGNGGKEP